MNWKKLLDNLQVTLGGLILVGVVYLAYYSHKTACPDVAIYMYCGSNK